MNLIKHLDYRGIIEGFSYSSGIPYRSLAKNVRVHTSYFSRVMVGKADFSGDQLFSLGRAMNLGGWELEYFLLLGQYSAATTPERKTFLKKKLQTIRDEKSRLSENLDAVDAGFVASKENVENYYQEPVTAKIHMYLTISKFRSNPSLIASELGVTKQKLEKEIQRLEKLGIVAISNGTVSVKVDAIHLDEAHPTSATNHMNWRLDAIQKIGAREPRPSDYHFSAAFSCDEETKIKIKDLFREFITRSQKLVSETGTEDHVCHMGFDLY